MIDDLDRTLEQLLKRELPPALVAQVTISFAAPDAQFPPSSVVPPAIDFFLYEVRENRDLRSNEWLVERHSNGTATQTRAPVRLDCSYLVTAWSSLNSNTPGLDEHHLLGEVIKVLLRHPVLPAATLQGSLAGQQPPLPTTSLQANHLASIADLWHVMGGKPKAALHYTVTISVMPEPAVEAGAPVTGTDLAFRLGTGEG